MIEKKLLTLVFVRRKGEILLGFKKRGFGSGKWNGFGGKVENNETILDAAKRELFEESSLSANSMERKGHLIFEFVHDPVLLDVHVFSTLHFDGTPQESEEMTPKWFPLNDIPYSQMWADDKLWLPLLLKGTKFRGYFKFHDHETILDYNVEEVSVLSNLDE